MVNVFLGLMLVLVGFVSYAIWADYVRAEQKAYRELTRLARQARKQEKGL